MGVLGALPPRSMHAIDVLTEEKRKQGKKQPGDFQPQDAAGMVKRPPNGLAEFLGSAAGGPGFFHSQSRGTAQNGASLGGRTAGICRGRGSYPAGAVA